MEAQSNMLLHPGSTVKVFLHSPFFGFIYEGSATLGKPIEGRANSYQVQFAGDGQLKCIRLVFAELQKLDANTLTAINMIIEAGASDAPELPQACVRFRRNHGRINLVPRHRRNK